MYQGSADKISRLLPVVQGKSGGRNRCTRNRARFECMSCPYDTTNELTILYYLPWPYLQSRHACVWPLVLVPSWELG